MKYLILVSLLFSQMAFADDATKETMDILSRSVLKRVMARDLLKSVNNGVAAQKEIKKVLSGINSHDYISGTSCTAVLGERELCDIFMIESNGPSDEASYELMIYIGQDGSVGPVDSVKIAN